MNECDCPQTPKIDIHGFLELLKSYSELGWAVQDQLRKIADGRDLSMLNGNALEMIKEFFENVRDAGLVVDEATEIIERIEEDSNYDD
jgi:hypothetical protein